MNRQRKEEPNYRIFEVDEYNLEKEWIGQPVLFFKWATAAADARRGLDEAKRELDVVKAEVSRAIRDTPEDFGLEKVTEAAVTAAIPEQTEYINAAKAVADAKHDVDIYQATVSALDHRKRALEKLVDLHGQNYYSSPKTPDDQATARFEEAGKQHVRRSGRRDRKDDE